MFRPSVARSVLFAQTRRTCGARVRSRVSQHLPTGRRFASTGGGSHAISEGSDIPWALISLAITVPASYYLLQLGPDKYYLQVPESHGHGEHHGHEEEEESDDEGAGASEDQAGHDAAGSEPKETDQEAGDDSPGSTPPQEESETDEGEPEPLSVKGKPKTEGAVTSAVHPLDPHDDPEKSKKPEGVAETAKIQGTVDTSQRPA